MTTIDLVSGNQRQLVRPEWVMLAGRAGGALLNLATVVLVGKLVDTEVYGAYSLCLAIASLCITGCFTWNRHAFVRNYYLAKEDDGLEALNRFAIMSFAVSSLVSAALCTITYLTLVSDLPLSVLWLTIALVLAKALFDLQVERERISENFNSSAFRTLTRPLLFLIAVYSIATQNISFLLLILTVSFVVPSTSPGFAMLRSGLHESAKKSEQFPLKPMLVTWLPLSFSLVLDVINHQSSRFYLNHFDGLASVGHYSLTADLVRQGLVAFFLVVGGLQIQRLQKAESINKLTSQSITRFFQRTAAICTTVAAIGAMITPWFFEQLFPKTSESVSTLFLVLIVCCGVICSLKLAFFDGLLVMFGRQKDVLIGSVLMVATSQILNYLLVPQLSLNGAAIAMVIAYVVGASYSLVSILRHRSDYEKQQI
ncbi:MAG: polysaccharide biosynthesis C-terminal domain-containing protein [Planctomycetota bacterium]